MTTQPEVAVGNESPVDAKADAVQTFEDIAAEMLPPEEQEEEPVEGEEPDAELDETEPEEEADDLPPIEAPVSWDAEAKERFAKLPREDQEYLSKREGERERFVQAKSQEAKQARQTVEQEAAQHLAAYERQVSEQLSQFAQQPNVQKPDPALLATDPMTYAYQARLYEDDQAQRTQAQQVAQHYAQQAQQREAYAEQAMLAEQHKTIVEQFPEYADPTSGPKLQQELSAVARELGYPPELISQARATDILAMRKVAELKSKADKYDALQASKMEKVRSAKGLPRVATPGVSQGSDQLRARTAQAALETARSSKDRNVQGQAFYDYLSKTGQIK